MRIVYRGNHGVSFSTESHVAASLEELGHEVVRVQESDTGWGPTLAVALRSDLFLWTQTWGFAQNWDRRDADGVLEALGAAGVPSAGLHLDLWWGLDREDQLEVEPFFRVDHLFTADGDHDDDWARLGINHHWLPPAVYGAECLPGTAQTRYISDVAFVGSWRHYGHSEWWRHRRQLLNFLRRTYRHRLGLWPRPNAGAVRGQDLNDLYASVKVVVGDSCFASRSNRYFSDRPFETVGRGGFLVMPYIEGLTELLEDGVHCRYFEWGDWPALKELIDYYLEHEEERETIRRKGQEHVRENHTYAHRLQRVLETVGVS